MIPALSGKEISRFRPPSALWRSCALALAIVVAWTAAPLASAQSAKPAGDWRDADSQAYRQHLENIEKIVVACRKARTTAACDPALVGPDDRLRLSEGEPREIRYDWLRALLDEAGKPEKKETESKPLAIKPQPVLGVKPAQLTIPHIVSSDEKLARAQERLQADGRQIGSETDPTPIHSVQREALEKILARREYQNIAESTWKDRLIETIVNWINNFFSRLTGFGAQARWFGWLLRGLLIGGICLGLVWALIRIERRGRLRVVPDLGSSSLAPSARDWQ